MRLTSILTFYLTHILMFGVTKKHNEWADSFAGELNMQNSARPYIYILIGTHKAPWPSHVIIQSWFLLMFTRPQLILRINKLEKNKTIAKTMEKPKSKSAKSKKHKSKNRRGKKREKKGKSKREKMGNQWTCPFACFLLSWFVFFGFYFAFSLFFTGKKAKQNGQ